VDKAKIILLCNDLISVTTRGRQQLPSFQHRESVTGPLLSFAFSYRVSTQEIGWA
jgi:hypothetical protein